MNKKNSLQKPLIFDIVRGSFVDGPGIRTVVFFKGCPLRCRWCQNPESQSPEAETLFYPERCIKCGNCKKKGGECYSLVRQTAGSFYPSRELARIILRDEVFYQTSSGGVTFSGGEPLLFIDYIQEVARILRPKKIHITVETCGYFDYDKLMEKLLPLIDLFLFDIKLMDPVKHKRHTGKSNNVIIRNFKELVKTGADVLPRVPLIPGFTAEEENLSRIADFFSRLKIETYSLLPYNPSGLEKWKRLGKEPPQDVSPKPMSREEEQMWIDFFSGPVTSP
ncbi:radical SAM protein [Acidobacteriota bacterium]